MSSGVASWWARGHLAFENFFSLGCTLSGLVWYYDKLLTPFLQPYSLWNNTITGYNGACAKVNVVFTARCYALARSLLLAGVCPPRSRIVSDRKSVV